MKRIKFINDVPKFGIRKGTIVTPSDFDIVTNEYIVHPSEFGSCVGSNFRFEKGKNVVELKD